MEDLSQILQVETLCAGPIRLVVALGRGPENLFHLCLSKRLAEQNKY